MGSSITESLKHAKEELRNELTSKGVKINEEKDEIEEMAEALEEQDREIPEYSGSLDLNLEPEKITEEDVTPEEPVEESSPEEGKDTRHDTESVEDTGEADNSRYLESGSAETGEDVDGFDSENVEKMVEELEKKQGEFEKIRDGEDIVEEQDIDEDTEDENYDESEIDESIDHVSEVITGEKGIESGMTVKERIDRLEQKLQEFEKDEVTDRSEELSKVNDIENRVESLELEDESDLEQRIAELENRVEHLQQPQNLDNRLTELEDELMSEGSLKNRVKEVLEELGIEDSVNQNTSRIESVKEEAVGREELGELKKEVGKNHEIVRAEIERVAKENAEKAEEVDERVEELWEALDLESAQLESRIHDTEEEVEDLLDKMVALSDMLRSHLENH